MTTIYRERDVVRRERAAFVAGAEADNKAWMRSLRVDYTSGFDSIAASHDAYPLPKVTRQRVVADASGIQWRMRDGFLQWHSVDGTWERTQDYRGMAIDIGRIKLWADLLANPNETVEDDG